MKDIYEILNDVKTDMDDLERVDFSEFEKKNIYKHLHIKKQKAPKRAMVAAAVLICVLGIAVPVTAKVVAYVNGNIKTNFKETVDEEFTPVPENTAEPEVTVDSEDTEGAEDVTATDEDEMIKASLESDGVEIRIVDVSRHDREIDVICELTFKEDIDVLVKDCEESFKVYDNLFNPYSESPFKNCYVNVNGKNDKYYEDMERTHPEKDIYNPWGVLCLNTGAEGKTLRQKIEITDWGEELAKGEQQNIDIIYKDIQLGDKVLKGEWTYRYVFDSDRFPDEDLEKTPIELSGIDSEGNKWEITDYAITQTGLMLYGMSHEKYTSKFPLDVLYIQRIHVTDNLGNEYLMYPRCPHYDEDIGNYDDDPCYMQEEGKVYDICREYDLYTGPAIEFEPEKNYLREWDENATEFTIVFEEEISHFTSDGKTFLGDDHAFYSEPITIKIPK